MLKVMRDNLKSLAPILWLVIAIFVLLVFANFGSTTGSQPSGSDSAATLGSFEVGWRELERAHQNLQDRMRSIYGDQFSPELAAQLQLKRQALEQLFNGKILLDEAERLDLQVSDAEVRDQVLQMFRDDQGKFVGQDVYEGWTTQNYGGPALFEQQLREDLLRQKLLDALSQSVYVSEADVEAAYREDVERASIRYLLLPRARFAEEARADRKALEAYYGQHREEYRLPEQRVVDYLLVDKGILRAQMEIPDEELRAYYDEHPDEFAREEQVRARHILLRTGADRSIEEARAQAEAIKQRIAGGEDFAAVAREVSDDPGSAAQGGDLGYFGRGRMTPEFEQAAFGAQTGELVGPAESPFGVHLIEVTDRRAGGTVPFAEARESVRARLASERLDAKAAELAQELRDKVADAPEGEVRERMQALAEGDPAVRFETSAPFGQGDVIPGLGRSPELDAAAFGLAAGELAGGVVTTPRGPTVVRLAEVLEPRVPPLDEVEARVRSAVERERQGELAEARLEEVRSQIDGGTSFDDAAAELGVEPVEAPELSSTGTVQGLGLAPAVNQAALAAEQGDVVGPIGTPQGAVLFEVTERKGFDAAELAQRRDEIREQLVQQRTDRLLSSLILERKRKEGGILLSRALQEDLDAGANGR
jgi:peptidyl-prolyl cis-trans isomerase D